jgi:hypothetical protein
MAFRTNDKIIAIALSDALGCVELVLDDDDVLDLLRTAIQLEGSQIAFAKRYGINRTFLNMVLKGKRPVGAAITEALGLNRGYVVST